MADMTVINLRLPVALNEKLTKASGESGVPKNKVFNEAIAAAVNGYSVRCDKPEYVHTCVRLPGDTHNAVRSMANGEYITINALMVRILAEHLGAEPCVAEEAKQ